MAVNVKFTLAGLTAGGFRVYGGRVGLFPLESEASNQTDLAAIVRERGGRKADHRVFTVFRCGLQARSR